MSTHFPNILSTPIYDGTGMFIKPPPSGQPDPIPDNSFAAYPPGSVSRTERAAYSTIDPFHGILTGGNDLNSDLRSEIHGAKA